MINPNSLLSLFNLKFICFLLFLSVIHFSLSEEIKNNVENSSDSFYNDVILENSSYRELFNQSFDFLNDTDILTNYTDENNSTHPDSVVTEDWGSTDKPDTNQKYLSFTTSDEDICTCDLHSNYCDINCCCDSDCTAEDIKVFSKCHSQVLVPDKNYCYQKDIIYRNNTVYKMVKDPESLLFCIIHDNLKEHLRFRELPVLKSHRDLDVLLKYQSKYISSWNDEEAIDESELINLKSGSPIIIETADGKSKAVWKLPFGCFTRMCSCNQEIHYLKDYSSFCSRTVSNLREECQPNSALAVDNYFNLCITSHAKATNSTNNCPRVSYETHKLKPKYSSRTCFNAVRAIRFTVYHSGSSGIDDINVKLNYINLTEDDTTFVQHFSVTFEWSNTTDTEQRSGNPGYQIGLPILTGTNSSMMDIGEPHEITMQQPGLSVLDRDASNQCTSKRKVIQFGKNFKTSCFFKLVHTDCRSTYDKIMNILLGSSYKQVFVGVFGNANGSNFEDWIEAYHEDREIVQTEGTCHVIKGLKINIAFAAVGTVVNPQYKILGVGYHYDKPQVVDLSCSPSCPDLTLSTSVSFFDVTEPAIAHYPKVPSIKANLPSDFFYPFSYGNQAHHVSNIYLVLLMCTLLLLK